MSASTETVPGRRPGFKLPAPLSMVEESDRNVWSPNRHSSSIVANGEFRSMSPRTPSVALASHGGHGSGSSSPKAGTPTRFEDPLLLRREPAGRRTSSGSPITDPAYTGPMSPSSSFRTTASFTARRTSIGLDFRRSVPGASNGGGSPAEPLSSRTLQDHSLAQRGAAEHGDLDYGGVNGQPAAPYASSLAGSESGVFGCDEFDTTDTDLDGSLPALSRRHSTIPAKGSHSAAAAAAAPRLMRPAEDDELTQRLRANRNSMRSRADSVTTLGGSCGGGGEGLQTKTHAALQQLRGELRSLSLRSMPPPPQHHHHHGSPSPGGAAAAPPSAFVGASPFGGPTPAGANVTAVAVSSGAGAGGSHGGAGGNSGGNGGGSSGAGGGAVAHIGLVSPCAAPSSQGGVCGGGSDNVVSGGGGGGGGMLSVDRLGDCSHGHQQAQQSLSRLSSSTRSSSGLRDEQQPQPSGGGLLSYSPLQTVQALSQ